MRVGVLYGGWSSEREISLISGKNVADALKRRGYDVVLIDVQRDFPERVKEYHIDVAFVMLHGTPGEDGIIQGVLEFMQIPYTGSGVLASGLAMDKVLSKKVFISSGIPTPGYIYPATKKLPSNWDFPVVVKPRAEGSSVGVSIVDSPDELPNAIALASKYGEVFIEEYIDGMIATCGILG
ncbi:D-alanine--D-alanine ligase, partial [bacterium]